jgi:thiol-disulfide isomerase/thioredoxin
VIRFALLLCCCLLCLTPAAQAVDPAPPSIDETQLRQLVLNHKGRPLIVNFWATWCGPCLQELPLLLDLRNAHPESELGIIGISLDYDPQVLVDYLEKKPLPYPNYLASQSLQTQKDMQSIPLTLVYNAKGREVLVHKGRLRAETINPLLNELLQVKHP